MSVYVVASLVRVCRAILSLLLRHSLSSVVATCSPQSSWALSTVLLDAAAALVSPRRHAARYSAVHYTAQRTLFCVSLNVTPDRRESDFLFLLSKKQENLVKTQRDERMPDS